MQMRRELQQHRKLVLAETERKRMMTTDKVRILLRRSPINIARMTLTIKLDRNWSSFQLANSAPPLSVTDSAIAPSARMAETVVHLARVR